MCVGNSLQIPVLYVHQPACDYALGQAIEHIDDIADVTVGLI